LEFSKDFQQRTAVYFSRGGRSGNLFLAKAQHAAKDQSFAAQRILGCKTEPRSIYLKTNHLTKQRGGRIRRQAGGPVNFKMAENPSKASRRSRVCFVSSFGTRHYFDWIFGILEERAGALPDQKLFVLLAVKRTRKPIIYTFYPFS
jgi:hypothetical protein